MVNFHFIFKKEEKYRMNKLQLSLIAVAMITTAATADISIKNVGGSAKLFYGTNDAGDNDFFNKQSSYGNVAVNINGSSSVGACDTCVTLNYGVTGVSTMGLEDTLVRNTWINQSVNTANANATAKPFATALGLPALNINDGVWIDTLNLAFHPLNGISNTVMVVGRQALDTPFVFTEKWNIAENTFDAAVVVNNDIVDTTLVGAWVGRSNGRDVVDQLTNANAFTLGQGVVSSDGISDNAYNRFLTDEGAYAFGAVTKLIPTVTAQAWYYIAPAVANTAWIQADTEYAGFGLGAQYVYTDPQAKLNGLGVNDSGAGYAVKLGYNYEGIGLSAAYSSMDDKLATAANLAGTQSKLYTEAWWGYGQVSQPDTDSFNVTATYSAEGIADLGVYYTNADHATAADFTEIAVTAGKDLGNLNLTAAYVNTDIDGAADAQNDIQVYATYKF